MSNWEYTPSGTTDARPTQPVEGTPAVFFALRDPWFYVKAMGFGLLLFSPLAFLMPEAFLIFAAASALSAYANARAFRFELSAEELRLRQTWFSGMRRLPLTDIEEASALAVKDGTGVLMLRLARGGLLVPGLREVDEAVTAIRRLRDEQRRNLWQQRAA
ncbi:MAG: hypothetical protein FJX68_08585 [Alphaproteobacteria bacterium]|nr:hypothetical protein [Alphaproteobacteria bacterium]